jgi:hypothetical protein
MNLDDQMFRIINNAVERAFARLVEQFAELQIDNLYSRRWTWYNETLRKSGELVGSPRNIVDTQALERSLRVEQENLTASYIYDVPYSGLVHQGADGIGEAGQPINYPARPWIDVTVKENDLVELFGEYLKEELRGYLQ